MSQQSEQTSIRPDEHKRLEQELVLKLAEAARYKRLDTLLAKLHKLEFTTDTELQGMDRKIYGLDSYIGDPVCETIIYAAASAAVMRRELAGEASGLTQRRNSGDPPSYDQETANGLASDLVYVLTLTKAMGEEEQARVNNLVAGLRVATNDPDIRIGAQDVCQLLADLQPTVPSNSR